MKLSDLLPSLNLLQEAENVEGGLRQAHSLGRTGGWIGLLVTFATVLLSVFKENLKAVGISWGIYVMGGVALAALVVYFRYTLLIRESRGPFRYTCYVTSFTAIQSEDEKKPCALLEQKMNWLAPDLTQRLNERLQRILYLNADALKEAKADLSSHIHISGSYLIRSTELETQDASAVSSSGSGDARVVPPAASESDPSAVAANKKDKLAAPPVTSSQAVDIAGENGKSVSDQASGPTRKKEVIIQARVRIGPPGQPEVLAKQVRYPFASSLSITNYGQIVERVYYHVASTIYAQIREDVQRKILLLPTHYLRAAALYYEAEDYARSETLQSYEAGGALYRQAAAQLAPYDSFLAGHARSWVRRVWYRAWGLLRPVISRALGWLDPSLVGVALLGFVLLVSWKSLTELWKALLNFSSQNLGAWKDGLISVEVSFGKHNVSLFYAVVTALAGLAALAMLRGGLRKRDLLLARLETGCANMLLFRSQLSALLAQRVIPIYEAKALGERSRHITERLASTAVMSTFERRELDGQLFNANATLALTLSLLGDLGTGRYYLRQAKSYAPARATEDLVYLLAEAASSGPQEGLDILNRAAETYRLSGIVNFGRAIKQEMAWRTSPQPLRQIYDAERVIHTYERVLESNPGNIGGLANLGYVHWLIQQPEAARRYFQFALDYEEFLLDTVMSEIHYGLARIDAEQGNFDKAYCHLTLAEAQATAYQSTHYGSFTPYYFDFINLDIFLRFGRMRRKFCEKERDANHPSDGGDQKVSSRNLQVMNSVRSFVFNDYGEACWSMYRRTGDQRYRRLALTAFKQSHKANQRNLACLMNLSNLEGWKREWNDELADLKPLDTAQELAPDRLNVLLEIEQRRSSDTEREWKEIKRGIEKLAAPPSSSVSEPSISTRATATTDHMEGRPRVNTQLSGGKLPEEKEREVGKLKDNVLALVKGTEGQETDHPGHALGSSFRKSTIMEQLLPHKWLWSGDLFNWASLSNKSFKREGRWERELNHLQVQALYAWAAPRLEVRDLLIPSITIAVPFTRVSKDNRVEKEFISPEEKKKLENILGGQAGEANIHKLLRLIEDIFSPADFDVLQREYARQPRKSLAKRMAGIVQYRLEADPANYEQLTWLPMDFMRAAACGVRVQLDLLRRASEAARFFSIRALLALAYIEWGEEILEQGLPGQPWPFEPRDFDDAYKRALDLAESLDKSRAYGASSKRFGERWGMALLHLASSGIQKCRLAIAAKAVARGIQHLGYGSIDQLLELVSKPEDRVLYRLCFEDAYRTSNFGTNIARLTTDVCMSLLKRTLPAVPQETAVTSSQLMNVLVPIQLEIDQTVLTDPGINLLLDKDNGLIPQMKARIQALFGVVVPATRLSGLPASTPASYRVLLNEVTVATGTLLPPMNGAPSEADFRNSLEPAMQEFERILIRNLALWVEVQEVQNLLERHCYDAYSKDIPGFETFGHILPLTALVRSLVEERTPITEFARIYNFYRQFPNRSDIDQMAAGVRMLPFIRARLWGNDGSRNCVVLGAGTEGALEAKVKHFGDAEILPLTVEEHRELITAFRLRADTAVVVVRKQSLRKHIWRLVSEELPELPVLAEGELVRALSGSESRIEIAKWDLKREAAGAAS